MPFHKIEDIKGIGTSIAKKLRDAGVKNTWALLANAATRHQRKALAEKTGLNESQVLHYAKRADIYRIEGVGSVYAEILEAAGVDSLAELAKWNAEILAKAIKAVNKTKKIVRQLPSKMLVSKWIDKAKSLPKVLEH